MKALISAVFLLILTGASFGQGTYEVLKLDALEERFEQGGDTLYVTNFWATWCGPCVKELPYFEAFGEEMSAKPVKVLLVSIDVKDRGEKLLPGFIERKELKQEVILLDEAKPRYFIDRVDESWSGAIPATLFVRKSTDYRYFYEGEMTLEQLRELVSAKL